jgi:outer membrane lipoprotein carrier protein
MRSLFPHLRGLVTLYLVTLSCHALASGTEQLKAFLDHVRSARGAFSQTVTSTPGRKPQESSGMFAMQRPGKFRWSYETPYKQLLVSDGRTLWSYDPDLKQAVVSKVGQAFGASPAALLAGGDLERSFELKDGGVLDGVEFVVATPLQSDASFAKVSIGLRERLPVSMEIHDNFGQITVLRFTRFEPNPASNEAQFRFVVPKGVDLIGE